MVDVKGIVNRYEAGLRRREAETEAALKEERTLREANAIAVGRCMRNVVAPVLRGVRGDLGAMGYTAHVDLIGREDPQLGKRRIAAAVRLTVPSIERSGPPKRSTLLFEGSFEEQMVTVEALAYPAGRGVPVQWSGEAPVCRVDKVFVGKECEQFLEAVFRCEENDDEA